MKSQTCISVLFVLFSQLFYAKDIYVNDFSTKGDLYTSTIGNDSNNGLSSDAPKLTLLAAYEIALKGDTIYVDNGIYNWDDFLFQSGNNSKNIQIVRADTPKEIFEKTALPKDQKVSPEIFYIINDKPVSREEYMRQLQYSSRKK
ncbi:hypothetical protein [Flavobacterium terrisoli]|uniref:hypothetical protein n=1 Tax=Flavobacterium terrisoli TaxID=3242195 RepID=UPI0025429F64|nr:hypothetical protein [Flavobacterium buctense]